MSDQMAPKYIVTFRDSAATEEINSYMHQIQEEGGFVTNRFPDMIARGFSAHITDSVLHRLEFDSIIDHITPDAS